MHVVLFTVVTYGSCNSDITYITNTKRFKTPLHKNNARNFFFIQQLSYTVDVIDSLNHSLNRFLLKIKKI